MKESQFICFYSYKGGTGRSLALANIAYLLASENNKVLIMDMDMEAPGQHMTELFHEEIRLEQKGLLELLLARKKHFDDSQQNAEPFFYEINDYIQRSSIFDRDISTLVEKYEQDNNQQKSSIQNSGSIDLMPASQSIDISFQAKLTEWDWETFYSHYNGEAFLLSLKEKLKQENYDYILIDSRTGMSDVFFVSTFSLADTIVLVTSLNRQNIEGIILASKTLTDEKLQKVYGEKNIRVILTPVPHASFEEVKKRENEIRRQWRSLVRIDARLPYVPQLALFEKILIREDIFDQNGIEHPYNIEIKKLKHALCKKDSSLSIINKTNIIKSQKINPFPAIRIEYWNDAEVAHFFVDPGENIRNAMQQFMPTVLFGSRGTGKTTLARWLSFETMAYRLREMDMVILPKNIVDPIGLWFRLDIDLLNIFNTREPQLKEDFNRLFGQFLDLLILRKALDALNKLGGVQSWCNSQVLFKILCREIGATGTVKNHDDFAETIAQRLSEIRAYINNPHRVELPYLIQDNVLMKLLAEELLSAGHFSESLYFIVLIDEYENFHAYQQNIVNTRLKQVKESDRVTYKLLARNNGIHTYDTLARNQPIEVTHDFRTYSLDEGLEFSAFKQHISKIIAKHLSESSYFKEKGYTTAEELFEHLSAEEEAIEIVSKRHNKLLLQWIHKYHEENVSDTFLDWMKNEANILRQTVAVILLNQGKSASDILSNMQADTQTAKNWYHNYHRGALHWLCTLYKKDKQYTGLNEIVGIAGNNTRVALDLCYAIIEAWIAKESQQELKHNLPICHSIQNSSIHKQSEIYFRKLNDLRNDGGNFYLFVERLGRLFEIIHKGSRQGEPEINHFIIEGELGDKTKKALKFCRNEAVLRWLPGNKQKSKADQQRDAWQLHPRYAPYFNISWRRKKMLKLSNNDLTVLFEGSEKEWKSVVNRVDKQYCQIGKNNSNQSSLFDEN